MNNKKNIKSNIITYLIYAGPATFAFLTVVIIPFIYGIYLSFTNWDGISSVHNFVAIGNYVKVFKDKLFWDSFGLTVKYVIITVILVNIVSFLLAYVLTSGIKGQNILRTGFFTPNLISGITLGFIWQFIFTNVLVYLGTSFNIPFFSSSWLSDPTKAFWSMVIVAVWQNSGYMMIIYIAGFMNVPKDLIEAASIDGASGFRKLKSVILPMMVPSFAICIFLTLKNGFMVYDVNLSLTNGGPYNTTQMISMHVYNKAFLSQQYGIGQSEAFCLFVMVALVSIAQVYITKKMEVEA